MKKNDIFQFTAPNGVEVTAVVVDCVYEDESPWEFKRILLCYGQNRLFLYQERWYDSSDEYHCYPLEITDKFLRTVADYAVLPEYDAILENYQHQLDVANDYADKTL